MEDRIFDAARYAAKAREAVAEGVVLLRNEGNVLPLAKGERIALFGRSQFHYYKSGTGSGGLVNTGHVTGVAEALEKGGFILNERVRACYEEWLKDHPFDHGEGWASEPWVQEEMPLSEELVKEAHRESDTAILLIGRTAGEDQDNRAEAGSYLLNREEEAMLKTVCAVFERTVVLLNVGNIIDIKWVDACRPSAVLYIWQGGQEGGNGVLEVLNGTVSPSGKLADTIAWDIADYPSTENHGDGVRNIYAEDIYVGYRYFETFAKEKVLYPFGFGLSYTQFALGNVQVREFSGAGQAEADAAGAQGRSGGICVSVTVTNIGARYGKEVVQVYCGAPQGKLGKPARVLCGFAKTALLAPGGSCELTVEIPWRALASYDDGGQTGYKSCYVLEPGEYVFYVGTDVRSAARSGSVLVGETAVLERAEEAMAPVTAFERMKPVSAADGSFRLTYEKTPLRTAEPSERRRMRLPRELAYTGDQGWKLSDVKDGKVPMETFLAQLSDEDLFCIVRGEGMCSPKVTPGTAGAFGGVTARLQAFGIPAACCADGPSGIRMDCGTIAFSMPNGACLASTFNEALLEELYEWEGLELRKNRVDTLLGPGINLHRSPLNGRNFEYFSEDPLVTGKMAAAQLRGMGRCGVTGTIKHFACNSQEYQRHRVEAVVSERALRELYLRGFEIAVKEGGAYSIMTSYNPINGFWSSSNYDMLTTILRGEWRYDGIVMTDWWAKGNDEGRLGNVHNIAAMIRAQNDLFMVTACAEENSQNDNSEESLRKGTVARGEYVRAAANICRYLLRTPAFLRMQGEESELDRQLAACAAQEGDAISQLLRIAVQAEETPIPVEQMGTQKGSRVMLELSVRERGAYRLVFSCRVPDQGGLAQIPLTVSQDKKIIRTVSLTGEDKDWSVQEAALEPIFQNTSFVTFYFGQSGMELKEGKLVLVKSYEDEIRKTAAGQDASN